MADETETFIGVTGVDEATARELLAAHNGDLNNAINFFLEHGAQRPIPHPSPPSQPVIEEVHLDEDETLEPLVRRRVAPIPHATGSADPFRPRSGPPRADFSNSGAGAPDFDSPFDEEEPVPSYERFGGLARGAAAFPRARNDQAGGGPEANDTAPGGGTPFDDQRDVEEEMMKAALEASMKEQGVSVGGKDEDLEEAISQSLKTAEQEQGRAPPPGLADIGAELFPPAAVPRVGPFHNGVSGRSSEREIPVNFEDDGGQGGGSQATKSSKKSGSPNPNGRIAGVNSARGSRRASPSPEPRSSRESRQPNRSSRRRPSSEERAAELMEDVEAFLGRGLGNTGANRPGPNRQPAPVGSWPLRFPARGSDGHDEQTDAEASLAAVRAAALEGAAPAEELDPLGSVTPEEQEEARMLEAAMMGIPYEARAGQPGPAYNPVAGPAYRPVVPQGGYDDMDLDDDYRPFRPPQELDPAVQAQREIRNQQDEEYLASLAADREKEFKAAAEAEEKARQEKEERQRREEQVEQARREERQRLEAEEALQLHLAEKASTLPEEPPAGDPGVVTIMVRMPDGSRLSRRLRNSDPVQILFDAIDVKNGFKPGSYRLVNSFPRRILEPTACSGKTLQDVGLTSKQEALFLEQ